VEVVQLKPKNYKSVKKVLEKALEESDGLESVVILGWCKDIDALYFNNSSSNLGAINWMLDTAKNSLFNGD
jgi:hypothetical protein